MDGDGLFCGDLAPALHMLKNKTSNHRKPRIAITKFYHADTSTEHQQSASAHHEKRKGPACYGRPECTIYDLEIQPQCKLRDSMTTIIAPSEA